MNTSSNPFISNGYDTPHGTIPFGKIKLSHYEEAISRGMDEELREVARIASNADAPTFENTILALENAGEALELATTVLGNFMGAMSTPELHGIASRVMPALTEHTNKITLNKALFERVKHVRAGMDAAGLDNEQRMLVEKHYKSFTRNGALLDDAAKDEFNALTQELSLLTLAFEQNNLKDKNAFAFNTTETGYLLGLPPSVVSLARAKAAEKGCSGWTFTLDAPLYVPFMKYSDNREMRRQMYMAYNTISANGGENDNKDNAKRIANLRLRIANLLGYATFADYVLSNRMAGSRKSVDEMLGTLAGNYMPLARKEHERITRLAHELHGINKEEFMPWDWAYYSEKARKRDYDIDEEQVKEYFEIGNVIGGVFGLATALYGISFKPNEEIPVYHPDVKAYEVLDAGGDFLAVLYADFYPRETKQHGAWMTEYKPQWKDAKGNHRPHVSLVMNFTPPADGKPSLLTHSEVSTLLHEFGHALHGMLSDVRYKSISGTSVYRDFVELPSQIMENYATEKDFINTFARHYKTGEPMPGELVDKIKKAENFNAGYACTRQVSLAALDMAWHGITEPFDGDVEAFEKGIFAQYALLPQVSGTLMSTQFGHIFSGGYAAGYYGYKWAEILDADAFSKFKANGILDRATAQSFKDNILAKGGSEHPMDLFVKFMGRKPQIDALLKRNGIK